MTSFDLLNAIYEKNKFKLQDDWKEIQEKIFSKGILKGFEPKNFLRACKLFSYYDREKNFKKNTIIDLECDDYKSCREIVKKGFELAKEFLEAEGIVVKNILSYDTQLIPLAVIFALISEEKNFLNSNVIRKKIQQWYWCGVFDKRYENGANDTKFCTDIKNVMNWINNESIPDLVENFKFGLEEIKYLTANQGARYKGIIALLFKNNCKDFMIEKNIRDYYKNEIAVEIHHIFPKNSFQKNFGNLIECVANKTPLSKTTNNILGDVHPSSYLNNIMKGEYLEHDKKKKGKQKNNTTELVEREDLKKYLESHWIDIKDLENDDF